MIDFSHCGIEDNILTIFLPINNLFLPINNLFLVTPSIEFERAVNYKRFVDSGQEIKGLYEFFSNNL